MNWAFYLYNLFIYFIYLWIHRGGILTVGNMMYLSSLPLAFLPPLIFGCTFNPYMSLTYRLHGRLDICSLRIECFTIPILLYVFPHNGGVMDLLLHPPTGRGCCQLPSSNTRRMLCLLLRRVRRGNAMIGCFLRRPSIMIFRTRFLRK